MKRGFTLIELLVVIAIIAILAAILFPVFARAREKARQSNCLSNTKQISLAINMYTQDYDELFPGCYMFLYGDSSTRGCGFYDQVGPYVKNEQIFVCPSASYTQTGYRTNMPNEKGFLGREFEASYGIIAADSVGTVPYLGSTTYGYGTGLSLAKVLEPANTVILFEASYPWNNSVGALGFNTDGTARTMDDDGKCGNMAYRHNTMMNCAFADGHAKAQKQFGSWDIFKCDKEAGL